MTRSESSIEKRKRKMKKKILGILLVICVIFSSGLAGAATVAQADLPKHLQSASLAKLTYRLAIHPD